MIFDKKIEDCIEQVRQLVIGNNKKLVAIVDPPRAGLHPTVVKTLRTLIGLDNLAYISCDL
jgi:tRNA/tmRNA/rRNA uracil-C5-methylase (TrmA/RlmC/RlmD family)